jgi:hypothetical protein
MKKFKKSIAGAAEYYESIESYEDRMALIAEFEAVYDKDTMRKGREVELYRWIRDNKL